MLAAHAHAHTLTDAPYVSAHTLPPHTLPCPHPIPLGRPARCLASAPRHAPPRRRPPGAPSFASELHCAREIYARGGAAAFMRGLPLTLVRGVPVAATVLPVYEGVSRLLQQTHTAARCERTAE